MSHKKASTVQKESTTNSLFIPTPIHPPLNRLADAATAAGINTPQPRPHTPTTQTFDPPMMIIRPPVSSAHVPLLMPLIPRGALDLEEWGLKIWNADKRRTPAEDALNCVLAYLHYLYVYRPCDFFTPIQISERCVEVFPDELSRAFDKYKELKAVKSATTTVTSNTKTSKRKQGGGDENTSSDDGEDDEEGSDSKTSTRKVSVWDFMCQLFTGARTESLNKRLRKVGFEVETDEVIKKYRRAKLVGVDAADQGKAKRKRHRNIEYRLIKIGDGLPSSTAVVASSTPVAAKLLFPDHAPTSPVSVESSPPMKKQTRVKAPSKPAPVSVPAPVVLHQLPPSSASIGHGVMPPTADMASYPMYGVSQMHFNPMQWQQMQHAQSAPVLESKYESIVTLTPEEEEQIESAVQVNIAKKKAIAEKTKRLQFQPQQMPYQFTSMPHQLGHGHMPMTPSMYQTAGRAAK